MVISLERGADLHIAQLMPLPLTISCFSKIQIGFTFLVPAHPGSPGKRAVKWVLMCLFVRHMFFLTPNQQYQSTDGINVLITLMLTSVQSNLTIDIVVLLSVTKSNRRYSLGPH